MTSQMILTDLTQAIKYIISKMRMCHEGQVGVLLLHVLWSYVRIYPNKAFYRKKSK